MQQRGSTLGLLRALVLFACISPLGWNLLWAQDTPPNEKLLQAERIFDPAHVVKISIEMKHEDWQTLRSQSRDVLDSLGATPPAKPFAYFPANITVDGRTIRNVGVRKKGFFGSLDSSRPSLKIKFDEYVDQEPSVGFDHLTLNNNKSDPSRLSQYLSYKIFRDSGTAAPRCNFARVTVNGEYLGIYSNVESIKPPFLKDRFGDDSGALFEGSLVDFIPDSVQRFEQKNKHAKRKYLRELATTMDRDEFTLEELGELLDIPAFIKYWATESLIGFFDGYTNNQNNFFVYRHPATKTFRFIPWGTDTVFWDTVPISDFKPEVKSVHTKSILANRLYYRRDVQTLYFETINELLDDHWHEEELIAQVDETVTRLQEHVLDENRGFARGVASLKSFIRVRRATVEADLKGGVATISLGARRPMLFEATGVAVGSFSTRWSETSAENPTETGEAHLEVVYGDQPIEFRVLGVTAEPSKDRRRREAQGRMPPSIVFHGRQKSNDQRWMMTLATSSEAFHASPEPASVNGLVIEGNPWWFFAKMMLSQDKLKNLVMVGGTATFEEVKREPGAPVRGTVNVQVGSMRRGDHMRLR